jgi:hypothetical protein
MTFDDISKHDLSYVGGIFVDFRNLVISGGFEEGALYNGELARAFRRVADACDIAAGGRRKPNYIELDEGKMFSCSIE